MFEIVAYRHRAGKNERQAFSGLTRQAVNRLWKRLEAHGWLCSLYRLEEHFGCLVFRGN